MILASLLDFSVFGVRILDVVDILIVGYFFYIIYRLLRGTIAFNIFIGVVLFYAIGTMVDFLDMKLLSFVLGPFLVSGVLILIIIFQPEVRQFLLLLGNNTLKGRSTFLDRLLGEDDEKLNKKEEKYVEELYSAIEYLAANKTGALIILSDNKSVPIWNTSGTLVNAELNGRLIISIFQKDSPLHDGAMVIIKDKIFKCEVILPVSDNSNLPRDLGLRHRAAIGVSENTNSLTFMVSEETGEVSYAYGGDYKKDINRRILKKKLSDHFISKLDGE